MTMEQGAWEARTKGYGNLEKNICKRHDDKNGFNTAVIVAHCQYFRAKDYHNVECRYRQYIKYITCY